MTDQQFWVDDPKVLLTNLTILPDKEMTINQLLNTITRLIIVIALLLFLLSFNEWWVFLVLGLGLILLIWYFNVRSCTNTQPYETTNPNHRVEYFKCRSARGRERTKVRNLSLTPRYGTDRVVN